MDTINSERIFMYDPENNTFASGTRKDFKSKTHVIEPSILYFLNMTKPEFIEYENCIKKSHEKITKKEEEVSSINLSEETPFSENKFWKNEFDKINYSVKDIYLFEEWGGDNKSNYEPINIEIHNCLNYILKIFSQMYDTLYTHYKFLPNDSQDQTGSIFKKEDANLCAVCLKSCLLYYINENIGENENDIVTTILKDLRFKNKVFCLYYYIQVKHQLKIISDNYLRSDTIKNIINLTIFSFQKIYIDSGIAQAENDGNIENIYEKFVLKNITVSDKLITIPSKKKDEEKAFKKKLPKNQQKSTKFYNIEKNIKAFQNLKGDDNQLKNIQTILYNKTSWGKISTIVGWLFEKMLSNFFYPYFSDDKVICEFNVFHNLLELFLSKGVTVLFIAAAVILTVEPEFNLCVAKTTDIKYELDKKNELKYIFPCGETFLKKSPKQFKNIIFETHAFIRYIEEAWGEIDFIPNYVRSEYVNDKKYKISGITYEDMKSNSIERCKIDILKKKWEKDFLDKIKEAQQNKKDPNSYEKSYLKNLQNNAALEEVINFGLFDFNTFPIPEPRFASLSKPIPVKKSSADNFCLKFAQDALGQPLNSNISIYSNANKCFIENVQQAEKAKLEYEKAISDEKGMNDQLSKMQLEIKTEENKVEKSQKIIDKLKNREKDYQGAIKEQDQLLQTTMDTQENAALKIQNEMKKKFDPASIELGKLKRENEKLKAKVAEINPEEDLASRAKKNKEIEAGKINNAKIQNQQKQNETQQKISTEQEQIKKDEEELKNKQLEAEKIEKEIQVEIDKVKKKGENLINDLHTYLSKLYNLKKKKIEELVMLYNEDILENENMKSKKDKHRYKEDGSRKTADEIENSFIEKYQQELNKICESIQNHIKIEKIYKPDDVNAELKKIFYNTNMRYLFRLKANEVENFLKTFNFENDKCDIEKTIEFFKLKEKIITLQLQQDSVILKKLETIFDSMAKNANVKKILTFIETNDPLKEEAWEILENQLKGEELFLGRGLKFLEEVNIQSIWKKYVATDPTKEYNKDQKKIWYSNKSYKESIANFTIIGDNSKLRLLDANDEIYKKMDEVVNDKLIDHKNFENIKKMLMERVEKLRKLREFVDVKNQAKYKDSQIELFIPYRNQTSNEEYDYDLSDDDVSTDEYDMDQKLKEGQQDKKNREKMERDLRLAEETAHMKMQKAKLKDMKIAEIDEELNEIMKKLNDSYFVDDDEIEEVQKALNKTKSKIQNVQSFDINEHKRLAEISIKAQDEIIKAKESISPDDDFNERFEAAKAGTLKKDYFDVGFGGGGASSIKIPMISNISWTDKKKMTLEGEEEMIQHVSRKQFKELTFLQHIDESIQHYELLALIISFHLFLKGLVSKNELTLDYTDIFKKYMSVYEHSIKFKMDLDIMSKYVFNNIDDKNNYTNGYFIDILTCGTCEKEEKFFDWQSTLNTIKKEIISYMKILQKKEGEIFEKILEDEKKNINKDMEKKEEELSKKLKETKEKAKERENELEAKLAQEKLDLEKDKVLLENERDEAKKLQQLEKEGSDIKSATINLLNLSVEDSKKREQDIKLELQNMTKKYNNAIVGAAEKTRENEAKLLKIDSLEKQIQVNESKMEDLNRGLQMRKLDSKRFETALETRMNYILNEPSEEAYTSKEKEEKKEVGAEAIKALLAKYEIPKENEEDKVCITNPCFVTYPIPDIFKIIDTYKKLQDDPKESNAKFTEFVNKIMEKNPYIINTVSKNNRSLMDYIEDWDDEWFVRANRINFTLDTEYINFIQIINYFISNWERIRREDIHPILITYFNFEQIPNYSWTNHEPAIDHFMVVNKILQNELTNAELSNKKTAYITLLLFNLIFKMIFTIERFENGFNNKDFTTVTIFILTIILIKNEKSLADVKKIFDEKTTDDGKKTRADTINNEVGGFCKKFLETFFGTDPNPLSDEIKTIINKKNIIFNVLIKLYNISMNKIKIITSLTDVQCNKPENEEKANRYIHNYIISHDGRRLIYQYGRGKQEKESTTTLITNYNSELIQKREKKESNVLRTTKHTYLFDFMEKIYGPNDSPNTISINLLKDIDKLFDIDDKKLRNILYFTYGFSGSGKTFTTNELIKKIIEHLKQNNIIQIKYTEITSPVIKDYEKLCSGRQIDQKYFGKIFTKFQNHEDYTEAKTAWKELKKIHNYIELKHEKPFINLLFLKDPRQQTTLRTNIQKFYGLENLDDYFHCIWESTKENIELLNKEILYSEKKQLIYKSDESDESDEFITFPISFLNAQHANKWGKNFFFNDDDAWKNVKKNSWRQLPKDSKTVFSEDYTSIDFVPTDIKFKSLTGNVEHGNYMKEWSKTNKKPIELYTNFNEEYIIKINQKNFKVTKKIKELFEDTPITKDDTSNSVFHNTGDDAWKTNIIADNTNRDAIISIFKLRFKKLIQKLFQKKREKPSITINSENDGIMNDINYNLIKLTISQEEKIKLIKDEIKQQPIRQVTTNSIFPFHRYGTFKKIENQSALEFWLEKKVANNNKEYFGQLRGNREPKNLKFENKGSFNIIWGDQVYLNNKKIYMGLKYHIDHKFKIPFVFTLNAPSNADKTLQGNQNWKHMYNVGPWNLLTFHDHKVGNVVDQTNLSKHWTEIPLVSPVRVAHTDEKVLIPKNRYFFINKKHNDVLQVEEGKYCTLKQAFLGSEIHSGQTVFFNSDYFIFRDTEWQNSINIYITDSKEKITKAFDENCSNIIKHITTKEMTKLIDSNSDDNKSIFKIIIDKTFQKYNSNRDIHHFYHPSSEDRKNKPLCFLEMIYKKSTGIKSHPLDNEKIYTNIDLFTRLFYSDDFKSIIDELYNEIHIPILPFKHTAIHFYNELKEQEKLIGAHKISNFINIDNIKQSITAIKKLVEKHFGLEIIQFYNSYKNDIFTESNLDSKELQSNLKNHAPAYQYDKELVKIKTTIKEILLEGKTASEITITPIDVKYIHNKQDKCSILDALNYKLIDETRKKIIFPDGNSSNITKNINKKYKKRNLENGSEEDGDIVPSTTITKPEYIELSKDGDKILNLHLTMIDFFKQKKMTYNNDESSRSHIIFEILVIKKDEDAKINKEKHIGNKIIICDLAGKEDYIDKTRLDEYLKKESNQKKSILETLKQTKYEKSLGEKIDDSNEYLLDLLSEGRMINGTLENLSDILNPPEKCSSKEKKINYKPPDSLLSIENLLNNNVENIFKSRLKNNDNISKHYIEKDYTANLIQREYKEMLDEDVKDQFTEPKPEDYIRVDNLLSKYLNYIKGCNSETLYYALFTINLNERRNDLIELKQDGDKIYYKPESLVASFDFMNNIINKNIGSGLGGGYADASFKQKAPLFLLKDFKNLDCLKYDQFSDIDDYKNICQQQKQYNDSVLLPFAEHISEYDGNDELKTNWNEHNKKLLEKEDVYNKTCKQIVEASKTALEECEGRKDDTKGGKKTKKKRLKHKRTKKQRLKIGGKKTRHLNKHKFTKKNL